MIDFKSKKFLTIFFMLALLFIDSLPAVFPDWTLFPTANAPSPRNGHSMVFDSNSGSIVLFGGKFVSVPTSTTFGDTWSFNGTNWIQLNPANSPPARTEAVMAYDPRSQTILLFGGLSATNTPLNDTWIFDGTDWNQVFPANSPDRLLDASLAYDPITSQLIFYGGRGIDVPGQTWNWTGSNWQLLTSTASPTPPRNSTAMAFFPSAGQLILFGGATTINGSNPINETWSWNGVTWTQLFPINPPTPRDLTTLTYNPFLNQLILFGGDDDSSTAFGDTYSYNTGAWIPRTTASAPPARFLTSTVFNPITNQFVLFGGFSGGNNFNDTWILDNPTYPAITSIMPSIGVAGTVVTVKGINFNVANPNDLTITFGSIPAEFKNIISATEIQVVVPPGTGTVDIQITTPAGISPIIPTDQFTYFVQGPPSITALSPASGLANGGTFVTINGTNFTNATSVQFGIVNATFFTVVSDTQITAVSPAGTGVVDVTVITPAGASPDTPTDQFTYISIGLPIVNAVIPNTGSAVGGELVTISGINFTGTTNVQFGALNAVIFNVVSDTQINAISPAGNGVVDIIVTNALGLSLTNANDQFTYVTNDTPSISLLFPNVGSSLGGTEVIINGTNFLNAQAVLFGAVSALNFSVISDSQIIAISPPGAGVVNVAVTTAEGISPSILNSQFIYVPFPPNPPIDVIFPPVKVKGHRVHNRFATQSVTVNAISWQTPNAGLKPAYYQIFRNQELTELVTVVVANNQKHYRFEEPLTNQVMNSYYYLVSVDALGQRSNAILVKIK